MSIEEQDQILGRLIREQKESRKRLAALNAKLREVGADLSAIGSALNRELIAPEVPERISNAIDAVQGLPGKDSILKTLHELREERNKTEQISEQLKRFFD
jgi:hypothetical protein